MLIYRCRCCGFEKEMADGEEAFEAGWDAPPHFTGYISCDLCPGVFAAGLIQVSPGHVEQHDQWKREGRPNTFQAPPDMLGPSVEEKAALMALVEAISKRINERVS